MNIVEHVSLLYVGELKSKCIKNLHIKPDTLTLTEEKVGKRGKHMVTGENFLNKTLMAYELRPRIEKWTS